MIHVLLSYMLDYEVIYNVLYHLWDFLPKSMFWYLIMGRRKPFLCFFHVSGILRSINNFIKITQQITHETKIFITIGIAGKPQGPK
jgi:hypothetical protein